MATERHLEILRLAAAGTLPHRVEPGSNISSDVIGELVGSGYLTAIDASSFDGPSFLDPRITVAGREYLRTLEERRKAESLSGKARKLSPAVVKWVLGIVAAIVAAVVAAYLENLWVGQ